MKLLIAEDEAATAAYLRQGLEEEGFAVDLAPDGYAADEAVHVNEYDAVLLDVMLPGVDGFTLCERWRRQGLSTPVLFVTARDEVRQRVQGLDAGGDDYLVKPFAFEELLARVRALVRRSKGMASPRYALGELEVDLSGRVARRCGVVLDLTARELQILEQLILHAGTVVSRAHLWEHVWDSFTPPESNVVDVHVRALRNKMGRDLQLIETVRGQGYVLRTRAGGA